MQTSLLPTVIVALATIITSYFTATATSNSQLSAVRESVSVIEERENNHYGEVQKSLERIEKKIDNGSLK